MSKSNKNVPKSLFSRSSKLLSTGIKIAYRELKNKSLASDIEREAKTRVAQAKDLVVALGHLKGAAMKAGQMLSMEFSDFLPPEVLEILRSLNDKASFLPFEEMDQVLRRELGEDYRTKFDSIDEIPIAAASIGQVHKARLLSGEVVVLKIQYPGIASSIDSDISLLKKILAGLLRLRSKNISFDDLLEELKKQLKQEVDYTREAKNLKSYATFFKKYQPMFRVPRVIEAYSTQRVLCLSFEQGSRIKDWLSSPLDTKEVAYFADAFLQILMIEFFENGFVQTDPNYGNFLVDGKTIVLLDLGAVEQFSSEFRGAFAQIILAAYKNDRESLLEKSYSFGLLDRRESPEVIEKFVQVMQLAVYPFQPFNQPFPFSDHSYLKEIRSSTMAFANAVKFTAPAKHVIFLNRKLGGMFHLLKDMNATVNMEKYWRQMTDLTQQKTTDRESGA